MGNTFLKYFTKTSISHFSPQKAICKGEWKPTFQNKETWLSRSFLDYTLSWCAHWTNDQLWECVYRPRKNAHRITNQNSCWLLGIAGLTFRKIFFLQIPDYTAHENHSIGKVWVEIKLELELELYWNCMFCYQLK